MVMRDVYLQIFSLFPSLIVSLLCIEEIHIMALNYHRSSCSHADINCKKRFDGDSGEIGCTQGIWIMDCILFLLPRVQGLGIKVFSFGQCKLSAHQDMFWFCKPCSSGIPCLRTRLGWFGSWLHFFQITKMQGDLDKMLWFCDLCNSNCFNSCCRSNNSFLGGSSNG